MMMVSLRILDTQKWYDTLFGHPLSKFWLRLCFKTTTLQNEKLTCSVNCAENRELQELSDAELVVRNGGGRCCRHRGLAHALVGPGNLSLAADQGLDVPVLGHHVRGQQALALQDEVLSLHKVEEGRDEPEENKRILIVSVNFFCYCKLEIDISSER